MKIATEHITVPTNGNADVVDLSEEVAAVLRRGDFREGQVTVFVVGSTAAVTTIEFEPGLKRDLPEVLDRLIPGGVRYHHNDTWGDGNGHAHLRASLIGSSMVVPFTGGRLALGTWQQIVLIDFDVRPRRRDVVVQILGE